MAVTRDGRRKETRPWHRAGGCEPPFSSPHSWAGRYSAAYNSTLGYTGRGNGKVCPQKSFSTTLVIMLKRQRQPKHSSLDRQADEENLYVCVYICIHMYSSRLFVNQKIPVLTHASTWVNREQIMLTQRPQHVWLHLCEMPTTVTSAGSEHRSAAARKWGVMTSGHQSSPGR